MPFTNPTPEAFLTDSLPGWKKTFRGLRTATQSDIIVDATRPKKAARKGREGDEMKNPITQVVILIGAALIAFWIPAHGPRFDQFRVVDIVALMASGMCIGVALSALLRRMF